MSIPQSTLDQCHELAVTVAPELQRSPLYITSLPDLPIPPSERVLAFTMPADETALREHLKASGRWQGPGTIITFCHEPTLDEAFGLTLHEAAHNLPFKQPPAVAEPTETDTEKAAMRLAASLATPTEQSPLPRWYPIHGLPFIRACLHLHHRAWRAGYEIGLPQINLAGEHYDLSRAYKYMHALRPEPQRMIDCTFDEILSIDAPEEFKQLFRHDCQQWQKDKQCQQL